MTTATKIKGRKGGSSSSRTPVEQPDDLQSIAKAKLLIALGEGEFGGGLTGQSIFLDGTPLLNSDGSSNFSGVAWEFRPGTQAQTYIQGLPGTENEISVGTEVKSAVAWTHTFTNTQLSAIRLRLKWPSLFKQQDDGDLVGYSINYTIELQTDGGAFQTVVNTAVTGKTTSGYERSHRIDLPPAGTTWTIRLRKITADANSAKIGDTMTIQSYTEVIDAKLRYPNTALLYIEFDSSQFNGSIPQISCEPQGRVIRVPDTYDPVTRTYSGTWTGAFKWAWTDNPAWIFYDAVVTDRFGLGNRLTAANIDKWELYQVAQYCDQQVPDGKGGSGTEPRYICNVYVQSRNDAYTVLRDFAAIFRGMTYWGGNQIVALADMPRDIDYSYTRANVIDGQFSYSSSTTKTRYTTALVSWSDPDNAYADAMEPVFEQDLVARYGFNQLELTAIGCTRQSEANRKGRWGILTNNKDRVITFAVGLDGMIPQPGYIIAVADEMLSGKVTGGRISSVNGRAITLDRVPDAVAGGRLILNLPSGAAQSRTIQSVSGKIVTVTTAYSETPEAESVWVVESDELYAQQYRVLSVTDNNDNTFTISAAYHDPDKYARIDTSAIIDERPISVIPPGNQATPANIQIGSYSVVNQGISVQTMRASWDATANAIAYETQWRRNDGNWVNVPRSSSTSFEVPGIYAGRYLVRVRAINAAEISSSWGYSPEATLTGKEGNPPKPLGFTASNNVVFGIELNWGFSENTGDTLKTEIQYSSTAAGDNPMLLSDVPYPQHKYQQMGLRAGQTFWYRAQLVDKTGNESGYTEWVMGQASTDAEAILSYLTGKINETQLARDLLTKINNAVTEEALADVRNDIVQTKSRLGSVAEGILNNVIAIKDNDELIRQLSAQTGQNVATIYQKLQVLTTADSAFAQQLDVIGAQMLGNIAAITTEQTARADADEALSSRITLLNASVGDNKAAILAEQSARADGDSANAKAISDLSTTVGQNVAQITNLSDVVSDINGAVATQLEGVNASNHNNAEAALFQAVTGVLADASISTLKKVVANNDIASVQKIETLTAQINDTKAQVQTTASAVTTLSGQVTASYNIKVGVTADGAYYGAGMAIGLSNENGAVQSQVLFSADRFAILPGSKGSAASAVAPFILDNGQVFMNSAVIKDGFITNAMIASYIQSNDYVANSTGWRIDKSGAAEFNNVTVRGTVYATDGIFSGTVYAAKLSGDLADFAMGLVESNSGNINSGSALTGTLCTIQQDPGFSRKVSIVGAMTPDDAPASGVSANRIGYAFTANVGGGGSGSGSYILIQAGGVELYRSSQLAAAIRSLQFTIPAGTGSIPITYTLMNQTNAPGPASVFARYNVFVNRNASVISR